MDSLRKGILLGGFLLQIHSRFHIMRETVSNDFFTCNMKQDRISDVFDLYHISRLAVRHTIAKSSCAWK